MSRTVAPFRGRRYSGNVHSQVGTSAVIACESPANRAQLPVFSRRAAMANREQRSNREKKKPKSDKKGAPPPVKAPAYIEPQLVRKPHKGKQEY
jgi:hypothetical protein